MNCEFKRVQQDFFLDNTAPLVGCKQELHFCVKLQFQSFLECVERVMRMMSTHLKKKRIRAHKEKFTDLGFILVKVQGFVRLHRKLEVGGR